ncbi:hypothetical protein TRICHSKD4_4198 [Roseibium sp. TrichSKD4]|uniref:hypothetical protein n=1 Tax=Roseibium sp. TrichSKD4 TaxID=744980 RepID=UPI0001E5690D|nr:hypothetical protein [Roseibium sp. TrichSKD4]EFO30604.1 hypothetical protein TRICHSKD4_4198 [Roseibium sp. TrichSKD4]
MREKKDKKICNTLFGRSIGRRKAELAVQNTKKPLRGSGLQTSDGLMYQVRTSALSGRP